MDARAWLGTVLAAEQAVPDSAGQSGQAYASSRMYFAVGHAKLP